MRCANQTAKNFPACGFREPKPPDLNWFIKNKYITKNELEVYKLAEKNGFKVDIIVSAEPKDEGWFGLNNHVEMVTKVRIEITKTKTI